MANTPSDRLLVAFGAVVRSRRLRVGQTQEQLAEAAGLHWTYIGGIERGERNLGLRNVARLAQALETSLGSLLADVDIELGANAKLPDRGPFRTK